MQITDPATGEVLEDVAAVTSAQVRSAYDTARAVQPAWSATPVEERVSVLRDARRRVAEQAEELAQILTSEVGKPIAQSRGELAAVLERFDFFCDEVGEAVADELVAEGGATREVIVHEPLGVVANISAWNYPWFVGSNVFVPALLTGNAVLYKPSEYATLTGLAIGELLSAAGLPDGVFSVLPGSGEVGAALLDLDVDGVFFTGSYATGVRIAEAMAPRLVPVQLELGGTDPAYVANDVDVAAAAEALADGAFYNNGQSCCSVERIYVHEAVHEEFVKHFVATVEGFVMGDPGDEGTYLGPLARPQQVGVLTSQVSDAVERGATLRTGGSPVAADTGAWFQPTVLTDVTDDMAVMREESFGPIIGIASVSGDDEAVARMRDTEFGLTAGVFCSEESRARRVLAQVDAGTAYWNCCDRVSPRLPWSGRRRSGIGVTLSTHGILAFTQPKAYHLRTP